MTTDSGQRNLQGGLLQATGTADRGWPTTGASPAGRARQAALWIVAALALAAGLLLLGGCAAAPARTRASVSLGLRDDLVRQLSWRELEPVEGLWVRLDGTQELGIVRAPEGGPAGYGYAGQVVAATVGAERATFLLSSRGPPEYVAGYASGDGTLHGAVFRLLAPSVMEVTVPKPLPGERATVVLVRSWPPRAGGNAPIRTASTGW